MTPQQSIAHYTKLHRDVAIQVLPEAFAADPDRLTSSIVGPACESALLLPYRPSGPE